MRKSTLLMGLLLAGCATAAAEYVVPVASTADAPKYYKVLSNRALTLAYKAQTGAANAAVEAGQGTFGARPYVGLYKLTTAAISTEAEFVPDASLLWRFEAAEGNESGALEDGVKWINLFSPDQVLAAGNGAMDFAKLTENGSTLYAFNLNFVKEGDELVYWENSYCISREATPTKACFDVKNFVNNNTSSFADGPYVFMAAEWNPFSDFGVNSETGAHSGDPNANNGSVFYFEEATEAEVAQAKIDLAELEKKILAEDGPVMIEEAKAAAINGLIAYSNVPALWNAADVAAVMAEIEALPLSIEGFENLKSLNTAIEEYEATVAEKTATLVSKLNNLTVSFMNIQRPYQGIEGTPAYLAAGEEVTYDPETGEEIKTSSLMVADNDEDEAAQWILKVVDGGVKLYNKGIAVYPSALNPAVNQSWLTVTDVEEAALMAIVGVPTDTLENVENVVGIENIGERTQGYPYLHAAGSGTNYNVVGWLRDNYDSASNWVVSVIEDGDGIVSVTDDNTEKVANVIYDINGRRVANITRSGLYIINGKKVIVKK